MLYSIFNLEITKNQDSYLVLSSVHGMVITPEGSLFNKRRTVVCTDSIELFNRIIAHKIIDGAEIIDIPEIYIDDEGAQHDVQLIVWKSNEGQIVGVIVPQAETDLIEESRRRAHGA